MRTAAQRLVCCAAVCAAACAACSDHPARPDVSTDAPPDADPCGVDQFVTGELVDFNSTTSQFVGVFDARFTVEGMPARTSTTAPNGRFELCAPVTSAMIFDVEAPGAYLDGKAYIEASALGGFYPVSFRALTQASASTLYAFDANRGHVLVFHTGDGIGLSLSRAHDPALAGNDHDRDGAGSSFCPSVSRNFALAGNDHDRDGAFTWAAGQEGRYVLFPNVDVSSPTVTLLGDVTTGPHEIPVAAGQLTLVAIVFVALP
jgi:hypothetical protein